MGIFARGTRLWARYKDEKGQWINERTGYAVGQEDKAQRYLARIVGLARDAREGAKTSPSTAPASLTVTGYVERWLEDRRGLSLASWSDDANRLRKHVVPLIGKLDLASVRPSDVRDVVLFHRKANKLAPRTIRHVFATMAIMFGDAIADELITTTPCVLRKGVLPKKVDKDPDWRATAIYDRSEIGLLMFDTRVLQDRRVLYALKALAGLRHSEAARLRWSHFNEDLEPLTGLNLGKTKTGVPRSIPVHPTLHAVLTEWKDAGWERIFGRPPTDGDLIVPTRNLTMRESPEAQRALHDDLALLELRPRRGHDLRRTFITLAQVDGARKDILEAISHGPRGDIVSVYTTFPWPVLCAEVRKLKIEPAGVRVPRGLVDKTRYTAVTGEQSSRNRWTKRATPAGFESVPNSTRPHVECKNANQNGAFDEASLGHARPNWTDSPHWACLMRTASRPPESSIDGGGEAAGPGARLGIPGRSGTRARAARRRPPRVPGPFRASRVQSLPAPPERGTGQEP